MSDKFLGDNGLKYLLENIKDKMGAGADIITQPPVIGRSLLDTIVGMDVQQFKIKTAFFSWSFMNNATDKPTNLPYNSSVVIQVYRTNTLANVTLFTVNNLFDANRVFSRIISNFAATPRWEGSNNWTEITNTILNSKVTTLENRPKNRFFINSVEVHNQVWEIPVIPNIGDTVHYNVQLSSTAFGRSSQIRAPSSGKYHISVNGFVIQGSLEVYGADLSTSTIRNVFIMTRETRFRGEILTDYELVLMQTAGQPRHFIGQVIIKKVADGH